MLVKIAFDGFLKKLALVCLKHLLNVPKRFQVPKISVEVVFALPKKQYREVVMLEAHSTVEQAIQASNILDLCRYINLNCNKVGIFSQLVRLDHKLQEGDRVEIYRPLTADPNELRRQRAKRATIRKDGT